MRIQADVLEVHRTRRVEIAQRVIGLRNAAVMVDGSTGLTLPLTIGEQGMNRL